MILIALGGNLPHPIHGSPKATLEAVLRALPTVGILVLRRSRWFRSRPVPAADQPDYINAVVAAAASCCPEELLARLHGLEQGFGRVRGARNAARQVDLDLIDYDGWIRDGRVPPTLPHPRMAVRAFVLQPLIEVAPCWRHPVLAATAEALLASLPAESLAVPLG